MILKNKVILEDLFGIEIMWDLAAFVLFGVTFYVTKFITPQCKHVRSVIAFSSIIVCSIWYEMSLFLSLVAASLLVNITSLIIFVIRNTLESKESNVLHQINNFEMNQSTHNTESSNLLSQTPSKTHTSETLPSSPSKFNVTPSKRSSTPCNLETKWINWCQDNAPHEFEEQLRSPEPIKLSPAKDLSFIGEQQNPSYPEEWREWFENKEPNNLTWRDLSFQLSDNQIPDMLLEEPEDDTVEKKNQVPNINEWKDNKAQRRKEKLNQNTSFDRCEYVYVEEMMFSMTLDDEDEDPDTEDERERLFSGYPCDDTSDSDSDSETTILCCYCSSKRNSLQASSLCSHCNDLDNSF